MRILWFANTPCAGSEYINKIFKHEGGGWLYSLDKALQNKIELHIVFYHLKIKGTFTYGNSHYYSIPIYMKNRYIGLIKDTFRLKVKDRDDESTYLKYIESIKPDLIHIHGTENPFGCIIDKVNIPVIVSIQGNITVCGHKYCNGIDRKFFRVINNFSIMSLLNGVFPYLKEYKLYGKMGIIERRNLLHCQYIVGRTDWDRRITRILAPNSEYYYGGELLREIFYKKKWQPHNRSKLIIYTTSGTAFFKGFETICIATFLLSKLNINFEWQVAGISEKDLIVKVVKKKLKANYPTHHLILMGRLDDTQLVNSLLEADCYVMPSHIENSPNNLCEAMLLGIPCIGTFAGGTSSVLKDKEEGILIQDGDPWAMAGAIIELYDNPNIAQYYGKNARNTASIRHNLISITNEYLNIYKNILLHNDKK